jgi:hypothetical protein
MPIRIADLEMRSMRRSAGLAVRGRQSGVASTQPGSPLSYRPARSGGFSSSPAPSAAPPRTVHSATYVYESGARFSRQQVLPALFAGGVTAGDALQVGLGAAALVQSGVSASSGSFNLTYDRAQRLLTNQARQAMPGASRPRNKHRAVLLEVGAEAPISTLATAVITVEWEGNDFGEIGTVVIERDLGQSSEWSRSEFRMTITRYEAIPDRNMDPRAWPLEFTYTGTYDPVGNGHFEFSGAFGIDAFGGFNVSRHKVETRSLADFAIQGQPEDYVRQGPNIDTFLPPIPDEQLDFLKTSLP